MCVARRSLGSAVFEDINCTSVQYLIPEINYRSKVDAQTSGHSLMRNVLYDMCVIARSQIADRDILITKNMTSQNCDCEHAMTVPYNRKIVVICFKRYKCFGGI